MTVRPIIVGYDGSRGARDAMRWALSESVRSGRPVQLLYALDRMTTVAPIMAPPVWPEAEARREAADVLRLAVENARKSHPDVRVTTELVDGPPVVVLRQRSGQASLLVLGNRGTADSGGYCSVRSAST